MSNIAQENQMKRNYLTVIDNTVAQKMIANAYAFFKNKNLCLESPAEITAKCLGISRNQVIKYKNFTDATARKIKRKRPKKATSDLDPNIKREVRLVLYDMVQNRIHVNLDTLGAELSAKFIYTYKRSSLAFLLKNLGFSYKKDDSKRALMEKSHVVALRKVFLSKYMENVNSAEKKPFIYLDETWVFSNGTVTRSWQDEDLRSVKRTSGDGGRYIIINAGKEEGFVENASLIFKSKNNTLDYHHEMNAENFEKWLQNDLLPKLEEPSNLVEKRPTTAWKKVDLQLRLQKNCIAFSELHKKDTLLKLCKAHYKNPVYVVDNIITAPGHDVLRLPPYHCIFNPIEMVWSQTKRFYDKDVLKSKNPLDAWNRALQNITPEQWKSYVKHIENIIKTYWDKEKFVKVNNIIINLNVETDESDSDFNFAENDI
ncbi:hypothetical protein Zmor_024070 [Zophobas morio]|uniref:Transposase n=1 Tax=Zophobas morio TaxID=2755281 RepID=A0AA38I4E8_9CUCU|nr:hypothetical protein Zmor_024070 [Zophobas morio]